MNFDLPQGVFDVLSTLNSSGFEAYVTGGTVRDLVMGQLPYNYTISTNALPDEVKALFKNTINTSANVGIVTVIINGIGYNVSTYRNKHTDVSKGFATELSSDLSGRDFTINAMGWSPESGLIDPFGGCKDIKAGIIRSVENPEKRFSEDSVRMFRAIRFSAALGFEIEEETKDALKKYAYLIKKAQPERILGEINKILISPHPEYIGKEPCLYLTEHIMPELNVCFKTPQRNKYHIYNVGEHILHAVSETKKNLILRWATLLHDIGKPVCMSRDHAGIIHFFGHHRDSARIAATILSRLRMDRESSRDIIMLIENHDVRIEPSPPSVKRMLTKVGDKLFLQLLSLQIADNLAKNPQFFPDKKHKLDEVRRIYETVLAEGQPYLMSHLVVNNRDLTKLGFKAGREIGDTLKVLLGEVIINPELNTREYLLKRARELRKKK